jgi:hypothetical protein
VQFGTPRSQRLQVASVLVEPIARHAKVDGQRARRASGLMQLSHCLKIGLAPNSNV